MLWHPFKRLTCFLFMFFDGRTGLVHPPSPSPKGEGAGAGAKGRAPSPLSPHFFMEVVAVANRQYYPEQEPSSWVEAVSLVVDALGLSTILFLTGVLFIRCFAS